MVEQLSHIGRRELPGRWCVPVSDQSQLASATRPELCVATLADVVDVEMTPTVGSHSGRSFVAVHDLSVLTVITDDRDNGSYW